MKFLLDTNTCIYIINRKPEAVMERFHTLAVGDVAISTVTLYELLYGAYKSRNPERNRDAVRQFSLPLEILPFGEDSADICGKLRAGLEQKGQVIGAMDMQIAATALVYQLTLVTNNMREFKRIPALLLENWF